MPGPRPGHPRFGHPVSPYLPPRGFARAPARGGGQGGLIGALIAIVFGSVAMGIVLVALIAAERSSGGPPGRPPTGQPGGSPPGATGESGTGSGAPTRLYRAGTLPATGCRGRVIAPDDPASMEAFLNATSDCLDRAWHPALTRQETGFAPPTRVFWTEPGRSPCGDYPASGTAAFYCALNNSIYIGVVHVQKAAGGMPVKWNVAYSRGVAHEYAHHVQETTGILEWSRGRRIAASSVAERNAITRRSELQAQCLAGVFMASVRRSYPVTPVQWQIAIKDSAGRGDDGSPPDSRDHGSNQHYVDWLRRGFAKNTTAACDTWTVPETEVS